MKKLRISVGIPAYNADKRIKNILESLINQKEENQSIKEIIIYSDGSSDSTVKECLKVKDKKKRLKIINASNRKGMAFGFKYMLSRFQGDLFIQLNDDIKISDRGLLDKIATPFILGDRVGLVSGRLMPIESKNFLQKSINSTFKAYDHMKYSLNNGNNKFTCDGKILGLSREFIKTIKFPKSNKLLGNVDAFLYLSCITNNFRYIHVKKAEVYFRFPTTIKDYVRWNSRNNSNKILLKRTFGNMVEKVYKKPIKKLLIGILIEFVKNPVGSVFIFAIGLYGKYKSKKIAKDFNPTWDVVESTKIGV